MLVMFKKLNIHAFTNLLLNSLNSEVMYNQKSFNEDILLRGIKKYI